MKRLNLLILCSLIYSLSYSMTLGNLSYEIYDYDIHGFGKAEVSCAGTWISGSIEIPGGVSANGSQFNVLRVAENGFQGCSDITSVSLPPTLVSVAERGFYLCTSLQSVSFPFDVYDPISFGKEAFSQCTSLSEISLPEMTTTIGESIFAQCSSLRSITLPSTLKQIGKYAFSGCNDLINVYSPSLTDWCNLEIANFEASPFSHNQSAALFIDGSKVTSLNTSSSISSIGSYCFAGNYTITKVYLHENFNSLGEGCFQYASNINEITSLSLTPPTVGKYCFDGVSKNIPIYVPDVAITAYKQAPGWEDFTNYISIVTETPDRFTELGIVYSVTGMPEGECAVIGYEGLDSNSPVYIPNTVKLAGKTYKVTKIADNAFKYALFSIIELPSENLREIGYAAFCGAKITHIEIPTGLQTIGEHAFEGCKDLASIVMGNSVVSIGVAAFSDCSVLENVEIPRSVSEIGNFAFSGCDVLSAVYISDLEAWCNIKFGSSTGNPVSEAHHLYLNNEEITELIIPQTVTAIKDYCFYGCKGLMSVDTGNSVISLGNSAFEECTSLKSVKIGNSVTSIGKSAFEGCKGLESVEIGNSLTSIGESSFENCSHLNSIEIPNSVTSIGNSAFRYCSDMKSVVLGNSIKTIGEFAFYSCEGFFSIEIPNSVTSIGTSAFEDCSNLTSIDIPNSVTEIGEAIFSGCTSLKSAVIGSSVTAINKNAFNGCIRLSSVGLPNSVTKIGEYAFHSCRSLSNVEIPNSVLEIGESAFRDCISLSSIIIPESVTELSACIFYECSKLTSVKLPTSLTSIGSYAFSYCSSLSTIDIPISVTSIPYSAFCECSSLTSVEIPNSVTEIGESAFLGCKGLSEVVLGSSVKSIGGNAFKFCNELATIICKAINPPIAKSTSFDTNTYTSAILRVPQEAINNYSTAECWKNFTDIKALTQPITNISINPSELTMYVGDADSLTAIILPDNASDKSIIWTSSDESVVTVTNEGVVTAIKVGEAIITAKSNDGSEVSAFCKISVIPTPVSSILIDKSEWSGKVGETIQLTATVLPENATDKSLIWSSSDESVATVTNEGFMTAIKIGETVITAKATDGSDVYATCKVTVISTPVISISIDKSEWSGKVGETIQLTAIVLPEDATVKTIVWSSSDESVATVNIEGLVTAVKIGESVITAKALDGSDVSASCKVTVIPTPVNSISIDKSEWNGKVGETVQLTATVLPEDATVKTIVWSSSDESVATVTNDGLVTAIKVGESVITAKATDGSDVSASCKVTVIPTPVNSISIDKSEWNGKVGETVQLTATVLPEDATVKTIVWSSSDESVATVTNEGLVTAIKVGESVITAKATDGSDVSASCKVTVIQTPVNSISIDKSEWSGRVGETMHLTATVLPEDATVKTIVWSSSDESVATVTNEGLVTAIKVGEALITAKTTGGSDISASCKITVLPILVESITISPETWDGIEGESFQLNIIVMPEDATDKAVNYSSNDDSVAIVTQEGLVSVLSEGNCKIIVSTLDGSNLTAECLITSTAGIDEIFTDGESSWNVYEFNGALLKKNCDKEALKRLTPGIYILQSGSKTTKIIIR